MSAILDGGWPNLADIAGRIDPDGSTARIANVLETKNPILKDIPWMEGNLPTGHKVTRTATSLPSGTWRMINQGVVSTKGKTASYVETCAILEDHSRIDEREVELNGGAAWRETEDLIKMVALPKQYATALFYSSTTSDPEEIHGLTPRYPATSGYTASDYVMAGTNVGTNAYSIWLITWEPRKIYGIFPKGTRAGLERVDKGLIPVTDGQTPAGTLFMWLTQYVWRVGVAVEDYRYAVRFQWDPDDAGMAADDRELYIGVMDMLTTIYEVTPNTRFYMNRPTLMRLNSQLMSNENRPMQYVTMDRGRIIGDSSQMGGERVPEIFGIAIRVTDALVAETAIS